MAGDWIKMRSNLASDPAVMHLSSTLGLDVDTVVGKLHRFWTWADAHSANGHLSKVTIEQVNEIARQKGFGQAMTEVGWLRKSSAGLAIPRFDRHMSQSAKARGGEQERKRLQRSSLDPDPRARRCPDNVRTRERAAVSREDENTKKSSKRAWDSAASELPTDRSQVFSILFGFRPDGCQIFSWNAAAAISRHSRATLEQVTWAIDRFSEHRKQQKRMDSPAGYLRALIENEAPPASWAAEFSRREVLRTAIKDAGAVQAAERRLSDLGRSAVVDQAAGRAASLGGGRFAG